MDLNRNNIDVGIAKLIKAVKKQIQKAKTMTIDRKLVNY